MSRIGNNPVEISDKVEVSLDGNLVTVKGPKGQLEQKIDERLDIQVVDNSVVIKRPTDSKQDKSIHGLSRSLVVNMVEGVVNGFKKELELSGIGYRAQKKGENLELQVGYSHPVIVKPKGDIELEVDDNKIIVSGIDKQKVGEMAANIRAIREPEPYNAKGIKYVGEHVRRKEGKTG